MSLLRITDSYIIIARSKFAGSQSVSRVIVIRLSCIVHDHSVVITNDLIFLFPCLYLWVYSQLLVLIAVHIYTLSLSLVACNNISIKVFLLAYVNTCIQHVYKYLIVRYNTCILEHDMKLSVWSSSRHNNVSGFWRGRHCMHACVYEINITPGVQWTMPLAILDKRVAWCPIILQRRI